LGFYSLPLRDLVSDVDDLVRTRSDHRHLYDLVSAAVGYLAFFSVPLGDFLGYLEFRWGFCEVLEVQHRGFYLRVSSITKMLFLWPLARG
jgi:hypothetical protein